jgi:hypothetical protein
LAGRIEALDTRREARPVAREIVMRKDDTKEQRGIIDVRDMSEPVRDRLHHRSFVCAGIGVRIPHDRQRWR